MGERVAWWDNARFFLITLVVLGHFADAFTAQSDVYKGLFLFIYSFHMPLFIFISGRLHSHRRIGEKCLFYVSVGFLLKIAMSLAYWAVGYAPTFSLLADDSIPWYLFAMTAYTLVTYLLRGRNQWFILAMAIVVACFAGFDRTVGDTLYLSRIVVFFPFYWAGTMLKSETLLRLKKCVPAVVGAAVVVVAWGALCLLFTDKLYALRPLFTGRNPFSDAMRAYGPLLRLCTYVGSAAVSLAVLLLTPVRRVAGISRMGERSINVYFWHWPVFLVLNHLFNIKSVFYMGGVAGKMGYLALAVLLSVLLSQKFVSYPLEWVRKICYQNRTDV